MPRWNGGVIGAANNPTQSSAKGIWSLSEATKAIRAGLWPPSNAGADPYFENVTMLLSADGTNGAQNNTFLDSSTNNFTITRNGNTTQGTFTPFSKPDGRWSNYFDGVDDYISAPSVSLGTGDFTFEAWQYILPDGTDYGRICGMGDFFNSTGIGVNFNPSTSKFEVNNNNSATITSSSTYSYNTWHHVALVRSGSTVTLYVNGTSAGTATNSNSLSGIVYVSAIRYNGTNFFGASYTSNFRLTNTAVYTGAFTPSTAPLTAISGTQVLTCQSNRFIDNSTNAYTITIGGAPSIQTFSPFPTLTAYAAGTNGGSGYFDGSGDYLSFAADTAFAFGTGDYTVEAWVYFTSITTTDLQIIFMSGSTGGNNFYFHVDGNQISVGTTAAFVSNQATTFTTNQWYHIAACRSGTTLKLFVNGTQAGSNATDSTNWISSGTARVGSNEATTQLVNGYMSGVRVLKGTAQYTSNFTVPTAPLTAITNTSLLLSGTNGGIIDTSMSNDLETVGNAQISTTQSKFGGASMYFDGTGDYLVAAASASRSLGSGDFTVEMWIYPTAFATYVAVWSCTNSVSVANGFHIGFNSSGQMFVYQNSAFRISSSSTSGTLTLNQWNHLVLTRISGVVSFFVGGTQAASTWSTTQDFSQGFTLIGANPAGNSEYLTGYIDDLRVTKGYARYTANFTPPSGPFIGFGD